MLEVVRLGCQDDGHVIQFLLDSDKPTYMLMEAFLSPHLVWWRRVLIAFQYVCGFGDEDACVYKTFYLDHKDVGVIKEMISTYEKHNKLE